MTKISIFVLLCTIYSLADTQGYYYRSPWESQSSEENSLEAEGSYPSPPLLRRGPVYRNYRYGPPSVRPGPPFVRQTLLRQQLIRQPLLGRERDSNEYDSSESGESSESSYEDLSYEDSSYETQSPRYYGDYGLYSNSRNPYLFYDDERPIAIYRSGHKKKKGCKKGKKGGKGCGVDGGWWYIWDKKHGYLQGRWGKPPPPGLEKEHYDHGFGHYGHHYGPGYDGHGGRPHLVGPHTKQHGHHGWGGGGQGHGGHRGGWGWKPQVKDFGWGWAEPGWGWK